MAGTTRAVDRVRAALAAAVGLAEAIVRGVPAGAERDEAAALLAAVRGALEREG